jgi:GT2 family glycosyltransferase
MSKILLGVPYNGTVNWNSAQSAWRCSAKHEVQVVSIPSSLLALAFNSLLCEALNRNESGDGVEYMAMLHMDLSADGFWIDTLVDLLEERQADFISVINAIKDDRGVTSSGIGLDGHGWKPLRRFTLRQLANWPATFNADDIGCDGPLLHNTGCWLADIRKPLFHEADERGQLLAYFTIRDRVVRRNGKWKPEVEPEDWFFSRRLHELGAKTYVTREVTTHHYGGKDFPNTCDWGTRLEDTDVLSEWGD